MNRTSPLPLLALFASARAGNDAAEPEARLQPLTDCAEAADYIKQVALKRMNDQINEALASYERGESCYGWGYGEDASGSPTSGGGGTVPPPGPSTGTGTNNQVAGADEADFVKNDGQYIYLAQNGVLRIVDAWPAEQTHEVSAPSSRARRRSCSSTAIPRSSTSRSARPAATEAASARTATTATSRATARRRSCSCSTSRIVRLPCSSARSLCRDR